MVRNSICRMTMHGRWWINDPDCILLRTTTGYSDDEIVGIATVKAMSGGSFIISGNLLAHLPLNIRSVASRIEAAENCFD
jgi:alpha-galactosidase